MTWISVFMDGSKLHVRYLLSSVTSEESCHIIQRLTTPPKSIHVISLNGIIIYKEEITVHHIENTQKEHSVTDNGSGEMMMMELK